MNIEELFFCVDSERYWIRDYNSHYQEEYDDYCTFVGTRMFFNFGLGRVLWWYVH